MAIAAKLRASFKLLGFVTAAVFLILPETRVEGKAYAREPDRDSEDPFGHSRRPLPPCVKRCLSAKRKNGGCRKCLRVCH